MKKVKSVLSRPHTNLRLQHKMVTVSALLYRVCDNKCDNKRKSKKSAIMGTSTSCDQLERTFTVTRNEGYPEGELNPELLTVRRGQVNVTAATFYSSHCHQS